MAKLASTNYAAHVCTQKYAPGHWPLLNLMVPRTKILFHRNQVILIGPDEDITRAVAVAHSHRPGFLRVNTKPSRVDYTGRVARALLEIAEDQYIKVITSRAVNIENEIDMPATLLWGRRGNAPARTFSLKHEGCEVPGFSSELLMSLKNGKLITNHWPELDLAQRQRRKLKV